MLNWSGQKPSLRFPRQRGSHYYLRRPDSQRPVVVPVHANQIVPVGTFLSILRQAELSADELTELLR
jgi:predicted RNA binding protein YcfA (HicA-like mRNA interferase family)